jgi:protein-disulfide isomerase
MTGEQLQSDIYIGPTYYMRLKHMVKDKINYRARGPNTMLTRQSVQGRANDGGLRIGEMERDAIISHGASQFLNESFLVRGDEYYMAVCNKTGAVAIYNNSKNLFLSPFADGPVKFHTTLDALFEANKGSKLVFKHFPLNFHQYAKDLATMFECVAKNQGNDKAVLFAEDLFAKNLLLQGQITSADGLNIFQTFGLSEDLLNNCKKDSVITSKITNDYNDGVALGINGTPALYIINMKTSKAVRINGALDQATLQAEFDKLK